MARKKKTRTRQQEFKARQRKSWAGFLFKVSLFVAPVIGISVWLIILLLGRGQALPILTLDFNSAQNIKNGNIWTRINYDLNKNSGVQFPAFEFGGPKRDVVVVFNDLLGSARLDGDNDSLAAFVFEPSNSTEHQTHAYRGLCSNDTKAEKEQWVRFEDYLEKTVQAISTSAEGLSSKSRGKILIVLDVDHPDVPARLPPQANQFIRLCKSQWETAATKLNLTHDVYIWLSHAEGQKSYFDSDFNKVESFFKLRFDRAISGDILTFKDRRDTRDIYYSDLKKYMKKWVESDSNIHKLAQTPTFLEPQNSSGDFPMLRFRGTPDPNTALFTYNRRDAGTNIADYWQEFETVRREHDWKFENPLLVQRATMLLLQLEKLWYIGLNEEKSDLFGELKNELDALVKTTTTIAPIKHSLHDALVLAPARKIEPLDLKLLTPPVAATPDEESAVAVKEKQRQTALKAWGQNFPDWTGSLSVWQAAQENQMTQAELNSALALLTQRQKNIQRAEQVSDIEVTEIQWNEIAFLDRIATDLAWPSTDNELVNFQALIQEAIRARDQSNQFVSKLIPAFTDLEKITGRFTALENRRRLMEDRLFANDHAELETNFRGLVREYELLARQNDKLRSEFETIQRQLIQAPHDYRYCLESLVVQAQNGGGDDKTRPLLIDQFEAWAKADEGYIAGWAGLGGQMIGALIDSADQQKRITTFQTTRNGGFATDESADQKGFASNPYRDFDKFDVDIDMSNADGNLYARRLLLWPGLKNIDRQNIRQGLLEKSVKKSGNADQSTSQEDIEHDFDNAQIASRLANLFQDEAMKGQWLSQWDEPIRFENGNENYFTLAALDAHRLLIEREDETAIEHVIAINEFHSKKSNFVFQRIASDLWGKPVADQTPFVVAALKNHHYIINDRLQKMPGLEPIKNKVTEIWNAGPKQQWDSRTNEVEAFCNSFKRFEWLEGTAKNTGLADDIALEKDRDNQFVFAVSPKTFQFNDVIKATFDPSSNSLNHQLITAESLRVYLRGHETAFEMKRPPVSLKDITYDVDLISDGSYRTELIVQRAAERSDHGHITIVIDCSRSMGAAQMERAKSDVIQFLEQISSRENIFVSLVAIGASRYRIPSGEWKVRERTKLPSWKKEAKQDVWTLKDKDQQEIVRVTSETLPLLTTAIKELQSWGETPILAGLEKAININTGKTRARLVVLLTDGFEYQNPLDPASTEPFEPWDTTLYGKLDGRFKSDVELVNFNFRNEPLKDYFAEIVGAAKSAGQPNFLNDVIIDRIDKIEKLTKINKNRYGAKKTTLAKFLKNLLPQPEVIVIGDGEPPVNKVEPFRNGFDRNGDGRRTGEELRIMAAIKLGADERPSNWSVGTQINQKIENETARSFADQPTPWNSTSRLFGNETLKFDYTPFRLTLTTGAVTGTQPQQIKFGDQELLIGRTANRLLRPAFEIASQKKPAELTLAPAICYLTFTQNNDPKKSLLLQDFNFGQQQSSNVHPLEFPEIEEDHQRTLFNRRKPVNMQIHLVKEFPDQFWSKIEFNDKDPWTLTNLGNQEQQIKRRDYVSVASLLPREKPFTDFEIEMRRPDSTGDKASFWIRIQPKSGKVDLPIDRWLVQILNQTGEIDRKINHKSHRKYTFRDGTGKLIYVEHHFTIFNRELENSKAFFGFAHIDYLDDVEIGKQEYKNYFSE